MDISRTRPAFELVSFPHPDNAPGEYPWNWVVNDDLHLIHTLRGGGTTLIGGETLRMEPGSVVYIEPFTEYAVNSDPKLGLEMLNFHFHLFLEHGLPIARARRLPAIFHPRGFAAIERSLRRGFAWWQSPDPMLRAAATARLHALAVSYWREFGQPAAAAEHADPDSERLAHHLTRREVAAFDAEACAGMLYLSVSQMNRRFRRAYGAAPKDYWLRHRYARARSTLHYGAQPIAAIARDMGFEDANYFSRWFKKMSGTSPREYRERVLKSGAAAV